MCRRAAERAWYNWRVPPPVSGEIHEIVRSLFEERSLADRMRGRDHRPECLGRLAALREIHVVPYLLPLIAADDALTPHAARTLAVLLQDVTPAQLAWIDEQARHGSEWTWRNAWRELAPGTVSRLAQATSLDTTAIGLLASHRDGFVRAAAVEALAARVDGGELPFLSLRANDWVDPIAARARQVLLDRLRPENRLAVLKALPFIARVVGQRRRDHRDIKRALDSVLVSDGGADVLAHVSGFGPAVRRLAYERLIGSVTSADSPVVDAALVEGDAVTRIRALRAMASAAAVEQRAATFERLLRHDPVPSVRRLALTLLSDRLPDRVPGLFPDVLFDRAASVRELARFVARTQRLPLAPRDIYIGGLTSAQPRQVTAAIAGLGEVGTPEDAARLAAHLDSRRPRDRRTALRALGRLDPGRAVPAAVDALTDEAPSVRAAAVQCLSARPAGLDFAAVSQRRRSSSDPRARRDILRVFLGAPKWEAAAGLLDALADPDDAVRAVARRFLDRWLERFNRSHTLPTAAQRERVRTLLGGAASGLPERTAAALRFVIERA
jgi:HEAT repeat protein